MRVRHIIAALCVLSLVFLFAGCGPDTAAQLKQAQDDLAQAQAKTAAVEKEFASLKADMVRCTKEREQTRKDLQFFAKKVNPLEKANFEKGVLIEKLQKELEDLRKTSGEKKADTDAAPAAPQEPAGDVLQ
jgi:septal ring factor EnvC (AmiA/AmiB activator)